LNDSSSDDEDKGDGSKTGKGAKKGRKRAQSDFDYANAKGRLEILAILAHELGHWMHMDSFKQIAQSLLRIYLIFFAFAYSLYYTDMPGDFGFPAVDYSAYYASLATAASADNSTADAADATSTDSDSA